MTTDAPTFSAPLPDIEPAHPVPLLEVYGLQKHYPIRGGFGRNKKVVKAVDGVDFTVRRGAMLGIVGESGCGKTTTGRVLAGLETMTGGEVVFAGRQRVDEVGRAGRRDLAALRRRVQLIFQDTHASLDPRMTVGESIAEPLAAQGLGTAAERAARVASLLQRVGLTPEMGRRYPFQFSGGQRQRIGIARALAVGPELVIADEPTSALDVSVRAQVVNLMKDLRDDLGLSFIFISHDMATVRYLCDEVLVMYLGRVMERGTRDDIFSNPLHPYTKALLAAVPEPDPVRESARKLIPLYGDLPSPMNPPTGCRFSTRCPLATDRCRTEDPAMLEPTPGHFAACHYAGTDYVESALAS
ncbi:MAG: Peptide transporter substrate-binding protein [Pseudonocardiales bacterium]|nr:Peptide transporter substrate-binding protein [Pseudonocardiales bacterium]